MTEDFDPPERRSAQQQSPGKGSAKPFRPWVLLAVIGLLLTVLFGGYELIERFALSDVLELSTLHRLHILRGILASLIVAGVVAWYLHGRLPSLSNHAQRSKLPALIDRDERRRQYARWFVEMRWIAASVALGLIVIAVPIMGFLPSETLIPLLSWWAVLVVANLLFGRWVSRRSDFEKQIVTQGVVDLVVLTGLLNASGGLENPLFIVYVFHVILAGILLPRRKAIGLTLFTIFLYLFLALGEYSHVLPHYTNVLFPHAESMDITEEAGVQGHAHGHASHDILFVVGRTIPFLAVLILTAYFTAVIMTRLRRSEADLEEAANTALLERQRLESVIHASEIGIMQVGPEISVNWFSQRLADWLDWSGTVVGRSCPLLEGANACPQCIAKRTAETGKAFESERYVALDGGGARYFRHISSPLRDRDGRVAQVVEVIEDITVRKALEAEAAHAGKLSVLGRMAAGIAHEIGNPLSSLSTRLSVLERQPEPGFVQESIAVLRVQIDRIKRIVHGVSHFARLRQEGWTVWALNALVEETIAVVELDRRSQGIRVVRQLVEPSPCVRGVRDQISQVVLNLLLNALEAMPEGGTVTISTSRQGHEAGLQVSDTGRGIDAEVRKHLFEPFYTTKEKGTGLGLSISYSLVHAHGGRIEIESAPGEGARFGVYLPVEEVEAQRTGDRERPTREAEA